VLRPGYRRVATRFLAAVALVGALAGCGAPRNLDRDQQLAYERACTSLIERGLSNNNPPRITTLDGIDLNLDNPSEFYSTLERIRGASAFNLHDPLHASDTARQPLDKCETKKKVLSSLLPTTTTTTTTTTTVPGS
jgi:hypothetical protein